MVERRGERPFPTIGIQFCLASYTAVDLKRAAIIAKDLCVDYFAVKPVDEYVPGADIEKYNDLEIRKAWDMMDKLAALEDEKFRIFGKKEQLSAVYSQDTSRIYTTCLGACLSTEIEADLKLYFCCNQKKKSFCYGDASRISFEELWAGDLWRKIYQKLDVSRCPVGCSMDPLNTLLAEIASGKRHIPADLGEPNPQIHPNFI